MVLKAFRGAREFYALLMAKIQEGRARMRAVESAGAQVTLLRHYWVGREGWAHPIGRIRCGGG